MAGVGGAAVSGRLALAGTEARSTELFSYKKVQTLNEAVPIKGAVQVLKVSLHTVGWWRLFDRPSLGG